MMEGRNTVHESSTHQSSISPLESRKQLLLAAALLLLLVPVWIEPPGSWLGEPDEARYAEVPREMLASGDFVTPRLNGVPYFEKPPLLYWANAASFSLFGTTPWAARLPTRLAGLGTVLLIVFGVAAAWGLPTGLTAGIFYLASPLGFVFSRVNLTDGLLTFFFAATLLAARRTLARGEAGLPTAAWSAVTGFAAAGAFLTKGLIGLLLPGAILIGWCLSTGRARPLKSLLFGPGPLVFFGLVAPWLIAVARRHPGFAEFFFIHEHFQRFATSSAHRQGPIYYFAGVFLAGFLPALPFFVSSLFAKPVARWPREDPDAFFFLLWFLVVFVFFSVSSSKLPPYVVPAVPAAAALAARGAEGSTSARVWRLCALLALLLAAGIALTPIARRWILEYGLLWIALGGAAVLLAGAALSALASRRSGFAAVAFAAGWMGFNGALALAWPRVPPATEPRELAETARRVAETSGAMVVGYRSFLQGFPWALQHPMPLADYQGELEPWFERNQTIRDALFWSRERFWSEWRGGRRILAIVSREDTEEFRGSRVVFRGRKYSLAANF
jgi:4-amino-4-deoxy-L-arabinose transferase-like glycosyltransferase